MKNITLLKVAEKQLIPKPLKRLPAKTSSNKLVRSPKTDVIDTSCEEYGYFKVGDRIVNIKFPR